MRPFKIYVRGFSPKQQCLWVGTLLLVIGIIVVAVGFSGIYFLKQTLLSLNLDLSLNVDPYLDAQQRIYQICIWSGMGGIILGIILVLAGGFAADSDSKLQNKQ